MSGSYKTYSNAKPTFAILLAYHFFMSSHFWMRVYILSVSSAWAKTLKLWLCASMYFSVHKSTVRFVYPSSKRFVSKTKGNIKSESEIKPRAQLLTYVQTPVRSLLEVRTFPGPIRTAFSKRKKNGLIRMFVSRTDFFYTKFDRLETLEHVLQYLYARFWKIQHFLHACVSLRLPRLRISDISSPYQGSRRILIPILGSVHGSIKCAGKFLNLPVQPWVLQVRRLIPGWRMIGSVLQRGQPRRLYESYVLPFKTTLICPVLGFEYIGTQYYMCTHHANIWNVPSTQSLPGFQSNWSTDGGAAFHKIICHINLLWGVGHRHIIPEGYI